VAEPDEERQQGGRSAGARTVLAGSRVTTFELFFDLVYVFTLTQVTEYMAHEHTATGALRGMLLLALVWFSWSAYAWLGNQAQADLGIVRVGMTLAMAAVFVVALTVPEAWHDTPGGLDGPLALRTTEPATRSPCTAPTARRVERLRVGWSGGSGPPIASGPSRQRATWTAVPSGRI
jgi:hypothetical protein